jgi:opacity protein-like surface antigen
MMKKNIWIISLVFLSFLLVQSASAQMYVGGKLGYVMTTDTDLTVSDLGTGTVEWDGGFGIGLSLGTMMDAFRIEGELEYRSADMETMAAEGVSVGGEIKTWSLLANAYYDFNTGSAIKPYVGAGLGFAQHSFELNAVIDGDALSGEDDDTVFAYQATLGLGWAASDALDVDFAYRYFATADPDYDGVEAEYASHNLSVGMRVKF